MKKLIRIDWGFKVYDALGRLVHDHEEEGNTLLGNFMSLVASLFRDNGVGFQLIGYINTAGASLTFNEGSITGVNFGATVGQTDRSVVLGTGVTANTIDTFALAAQIAHGVGAGQLSYGGTNRVLPVAASNPRVHQEQRLFGGNAVGSVTVNEAGLIYRDSNLNISLLIERSIVTPFTVPANGAVVANCMISVSV